MPAYNGVRASETNLVHTGSGYLLGYLVSHEESTAQAVFFYDNTEAGGTIIQKVFIAPEQSPAYIRWKTGIAFSTGLYVVPGNCEVSVWVSGKQSPAARGV
jgi:hypothetical protein